MTECVTGRSWPNVLSEGAEKIHWYLREHGWEDLDARDVGVAWRVRLSGVTVTYETRRRTLYSSGSRDFDPQIERSWKAIDRLTPPRFPPFGRPLLVGLDEANTRQVVGPVVAVGVMIPARLAAATRDIVETAATKKSHPTAYWERLYRCLTALVSDGLRFHVETIAPDVCDNASTYPLLGAAYEKVLAALLHETPLASCQVVLDDYGITGTPLARTLDELAEEGIDKVVEPRADDHYLAARAASVIARRERVHFLEDLRNDPEYEVGGLAVPSGTAGIPSTKAWLDAWESSSRPWPWFVKKSIRDARAGSTTGGN